jgi:hypothetical protein
MAGTTFVAVTAFVLAFDGSRGAAADAGIAQAGWYPWCIEGVIVCASLCTLVLDRRWPWFILLAFTAVSVAANVLHAWEQPGWMWWSLAFAAVPPLALPICVHLVLMVVGRPRGLVTAGSVGTSSGEEVTDAGGSGEDPVPVRNPGPSALDSLPALAHANGNGHGVTLKKRAEDEALKYLEDHGVLPSENVLAGLAQCSRGTARNALAPLKKG